MIRAKIIAAIVLVGLAVGIVGGLFIGPSLFYAGLTTTIAGIVALAAYALLKRPDAVMNTFVLELDDEPTTSPAPTRVDVLTTEHEFRLSDKR